MIPASVLAMSGLFAFSVVLGWSFSPDSPWRQTPSRISAYPFALNLQPGSQPEHEIAFYRARIQANPEGFLDLLSLAQVYLQRAKQTGEESWYMLAQQATERSLSRYQKSPEAYLILARIALAKHDFKQALQHTQKAQQLKPDELGVWPVFATIYLALGDLKQAQQAAQQFVERSPHLESYSQLALVQDAQGQTEQAMNTLKQGLDLEQPGQMATSALARVWLGRFYVKQSKYDEAEDLFREALRIQDEHHLALSALAELELKRDYPQKAAEYYQRAYAAYPASPYLVGQAKSLSKAQRASEAEPIWQLAESNLRRSLAQGEFGHRRDLAQLLLERKQPQEALKLMQAEMQLRQDAETQSVYSRALLANQDQIKSHRP